MNFVPPSSHAHRLPSGHCQPTLTRLISHLRGFAYRRRHDPRWTMDFVSAGFRDVTGYDPHRIIDNASIAFGDLIARADWSHVTEQVRLAVLHRRRATVEYVIRTAHGTPVRIEDRFTPVTDDAGRVLAIEGVIDHARSHLAPVNIPIPVPPAAEHAAFAAHPGLRHD